MNFRFAAQGSRRSDPVASSQPSEAILVIVQSAGAESPKGVFALAPEIR